MGENEFYSEEFNAIMKRRIPAVIKWGWIIVGSLFFLIFISCWVIEYPNVAAYQINLNRDTTMSECTGVMFLAQSEDSLFVPGQDIQVKLSKYSYLEYGTIKGAIKSLQFNSKINKNVVAIAFPQGLQTSSGKILAFEEGLTGYCEMITSKEKLIKRILPSFLKLK